MSKIRDIRPVNMPAKVSEQLPPKAAEPKPAKIFRVELGFPAHEVLPVFDVEAATEQEAFDVLVKWFRQKLRVVG